MAIRKRRKYIMLATSIGSTGLTTIVTIVILAILVTAALKSAKYVVTKTGTPGQVAGLELMLIWLFTPPDPVSGYACSDPNFINPQNPGDATEAMTLDEAIPHDSPGSNELAAAMWEGSYLSSGWKPSLVTNGAFGAYQIVDPGVGQNVTITRQDALNPAKATNYMLGRYSQAANVVDPNLWNSHPAQALAAVAYGAEQPAKPYTTAQIQAAYKATMTKMKKLGMPTDFGGPAVPTGPVAGSILQKNPALFQAINNAAHGDKNLQLALLMGSYLESTWRNDQVGGGAYGPFQIQHPSDAPARGPPVHPDITVAQAQDPAYATNYMLAAYKAGMDPSNTNNSVTVPAALWGTDPEKGAEETVFNAEQPGTDYYFSEGAAVHEAYKASLKVLLAQGTSTAFIDPSCSATLTPPKTWIKNDATFKERDTVITAAESQLGVPYTWGGGHSAYGPTIGLCGSAASHNSCNITGFDCSGLTRFAFHKANIPIGDTASDQWATTKFREVTMSAIAPGDLLFWTGADGSRSSPGHVGIYISQGKAIMAPQSGDVVKFVDITTAFWQDSFVGATSPF